MTRDASERTSGAPRRGLRPSGTTDVLRRLAALALLVAFAAGCAGGPRRLPLTTPRPVAYLVAAPDLLFVVVHPDPPIERTVAVRPDGMISIDLIGDVQAEGRTVDDIAQEIQGRIQPVKPGARVTVSVEEALSSAVTVLGEVNAPAELVLTRETSLMEALGRAGGLTRFANKGAVRLIRPANELGEVFVIDIGAIENGDVTWNLALQDGDTVVVPPTLLARIGYAMAQLFFPFQPLFGIGQGVGAVRAF